MPKDENIQEYSNVNKDYEYYSYQLQDFGRLTVVDQRSVSYYLE